MRRLTNDHHNLMGRQRLRSGRLDQVDHLSGDELFGLQILNFIRLDRGRSTGNNPRKHLLWREILIRILTLWRLLIHLNDQITSLLIRHDPKSKRQLLRQLQRLWAALLQIDFDLIYELYHPNWQS